MLFRSRPAIPPLLEINGRSVPVVVTRRASARAVRLKANSVSGAVEISLPVRGGEAAALALLKSHQVWLADRIAAWPRPIPFAPGFIIPIDGAPVLIDWQASHPRTPQFQGENLRLGGPADSVALRIERWLKARAKADLEQATHGFAAQLGRRVARVSIGDPASRWGSCAGWNRPEGARISYSWRLIMAPRFVRHAIAAHEAAHLVHPNHSAEFHALNRALDPQATEARRWLARHGAALHWIGRPL